MTPESSLPTAVPRRLAVAAWAIALACASVPVVACPLCDTGNGEQVRAGILNEDFGRTLLAVALPFPILLGLVAAIHFGWPKRARTAERLETKDTPTERTGTDEH